MVSITILLTPSKNYAIVKITEVLLSKKTKTEDIIRTASNWSYPLPDLLSEKRPYRNKTTKEIKYFNEYDFHVEEFKNVAFYGFMGSMQFHRYDWELIEETETIKVLYGPGKKEKNT